MPPVFRESAYFRESRLIARLLAVDALAAEPVGHAVVQQERLRDGSRKITRITEVQGMEGEMRPTGIRPNFSPRPKAAGFKLSGEMFGAGAMGATVKQAGRR